MSGKMKAVLLRKAGNLGRRWTLALRPAPKISSAMTVSQTVLVLVDLDGVGRSVDQIFCGCPPIAICLVSPPHG